MQNILLTDKVPPSRPDLEKTILGTLLSYPSGIDEIKQILEPSAFYVTKHSEIYSTMIKMRETGIEIDQITLPEYIKRDGFRIEYDIELYIAELCENIGTIRSIGEYVKILNEKSIIRNVLSTYSAIATECFSEDPKLDNILSRMEHASIEIGNSCDNAKINRRKTGQIIKPCDLKERMFEYRKSGLSGIVASCCSLHEVYPTLSKHIKFATGMLNIFTGIPGHGKSEIHDQIMVYLSQLHGWKWGIFSPENYPYERHVQKLIEKIIGKQFFEINESEFSTVLEFINNFFVWIEPDEDNINIETLLNMNLQCVKDHKVKGVIWDPWNEIEMNPKAHEKETDYIGRMLGKIRRHARRHEYMMDIIAHPTKIQKDLKTKKYLVPTLYDINGSANWYNKADNGFCTYRHFAPGGVQPVPNIDFHIQKIKFKIHGEVGVVQFNYEKKSGRFIEYNAYQEEMEF